MTSVPAATTNNVLTANGTAWVSGTPQGGPAPVVTIYTSPSPWTKSPTLKSVKVTMVSGGGSGGSSNNQATSKAAGGGGGGGGYGFFPAPSIPGPVTVTVGQGGAAVSTPPSPTTGFTFGNAGTSSSFGALFTITGGSGGQALSSGTVPISPGGAITIGPTIFGAPGDYGPNNIANQSAGAGGDAWNSWGQGGTGISTVGNPNPQQATGYGAGGGGYGGAPLGVPSQAGRAGFVIVEEFY